MCGQVVTELPGVATSARAARQTVEAICRRWGLREQLPADLALPVGELVANAVVHAGTRIHLIVSLANAELEIAVRDQSPKPPVPRPPRSDLLGDLDHIADVDTLPTDPGHPVWSVGASGSVMAGRGLHIVSAVTDQWGVVDYIGGKDVWFRVRVPSLQPTLPCPCPHSSRRSPGGMPLVASIYE